MTRNKAPVLSGEEVFPDNYASGFQGCYEAMRAVCEDVLRFSAENMRCDYAGRWDLEWTQLPRCAPHFTNCPRLFRSMVKVCPPPLATK